VLHMLVRRIVLGVLTLWLVSVLVFVSTNALPGDAARSILGRNATPETLAALRAELKLDRSLPEQYTSWLSGVVRGDLGQSLADGEPVTDLLSSRLSNSAFLVAVAAAISIPLSIGIGILSAMRRDSWLDHAMSTANLGLAAVPEFVIGTACVVLFGTVVFQVLPPVSLIPPGEPAWRHLDEVWLPALTLVLAVAPYISRIMRGSMIEVLESDYVEMARLKGLPERDVILWHALPNAIVPAIQVIALQLSYMAGGIVVVEFVFGFPGIGGALIQAVSHRDLPVLQAVVLVIAGVYVVVNLIADVLTILASPRLRTALR
jgi:peptide/nickel transport system permease protein